MIYWVILITLYFSYSLFECNLFVFSRWPHKACARVSASLPQLRRSRPWGSVNQTTPCSRYGAAPLTRVFLKPRSAAAVLVTSPTAPTRSSGRSPAGSASKLGGQLPDAENENVDCLQGDELITNQNKHNWKWDYFFSSRNMMRRFEIVIII